MALVDFEELLTRCRNPKALSFIDEAVRCYRAGCFRASIVFCWNAVVRDLVDKISELAVAGDVEAKRVREKFLSAVQKTTPRDMLDFERTILDVCSGNNLPILTKSEKTDLDRLRLDRHRCAHPAYVDENEIFSASAELARLHIFNAVTCALEHEASHGSYAVDKVIEVIRSNYFPYLEEDLDDVVAVLSDTPIFNLRDSSLKKLIFHLVSFVAVEDFTLALKASLCLKVCQQKRYELVEEVLVANLPKICSGLNDEQMKHFLRVIEFTPLLSSADISLIGDANLARLKSYLQEIPSRDYCLLDRFIGYDQLRDACQVRLVGATLNDLSSILSNDGWGVLKDSIAVYESEEILNSLIEVYLNCSSYSDSMSAADLVCRHMFLFSKDQVLQLARGVWRNDQIYGSKYSFPKFLHSIKTENSCFSEEEIDVLLEEARVDACSSE